MTANTGRTHAKRIQFFLDNSVGTLTDLSAYVDSVGSVGLAYDAQDVTAYSDGAKNVGIGQPVAPLQIGGPVDTALITHMTAINGVDTPLSLDIRVGIRHAWESGEPQFGISSSASSGYVVHSFVVDMNTNRWIAMLNVVGSTAPAWGTTAET